MSTVLSMLAQVLHLGLMLVAAPTVSGMIAWLDARLSGAGARLIGARLIGARPSGADRSGQGPPPLLAPWRELARLVRKTPAIAEDVTYISRVAPALALGATLSAAALTPSFTLGMTLAPAADVLVIVSLLSLGRVATALAALDSGAARPGLAVQGNSALAVLAEPALMLCVVTVGLMGGSFNLDLVIGQQREGLLLPAGASAIAATAMLAVLLAEASSDTAGLEHLMTGVDLALVRVARWLRRLVWIDLIGGLFLPAGMAAAEAGPLSWLIGLAMWTVKLAAFVLGLTAVRSILGRIPAHSLPDLLGVAALLALLALVMALASTGTA